MRIKWIFPSLALLLMVGPSWADAPTPGVIPAKRQPPKPVEMPVRHPPSEAGDAPLPAFGKTHPQCVEWTDSCAVCSRISDKTHCSTLGVACQPAEAHCSKSRNE